MTPDEASTNEWSAPLRKHFRTIIFDWDGTAVPDRRTPVSEMVRALNHTLERDTICAIITGTKFQAIDHQCTRFLSPRAKQNLYVCTNRGSEVYSFSKSGEPTLRFTRHALQAEDHALTQVVLTLQNRLTGFGLETQVISDRMNRRKLDLIPTPRWKDPKKSEFRELLSDVQARLLSAGLTGGLKEVVELAIQITKDCALPNAKITSDIKHVEIGLTDKSDSVSWLLENVISPLDISPQAVAIFGDEFGPLGGIRGSDTLMMIRGLEPATVVSVGVEPNGVPQGVAHISGGPRRFTEFLCSQTERRGAPLQATSTPTADPSWLIEQEGFDPSRERELESIFALGNGYLGIRGSSDTPIPSSQGDLFIAGIYSKKIVTLPYSEAQFITTADRDNPYSELVPFPFPFRMAITTEAGSISLASSTLKNYSRFLDLRQGLLFAVASFEDTYGKKTTLRTLRCASLKDPHLLLQTLEITCENYSGPLEVNVSLAVSDFHLNHPHLHVKNIENSGSPTELFEFETKASAYKICLACQVFENGKETDSFRIQTQAKPGEPLRIQKFISVYTSRDVDDPSAQARNHILSKECSDFYSYISDHCRAWSETWTKTDILFPDDPALTQAERFNIYHLRAAVNHDPKISIGARTLTGRAYEGHIFWDVEIFMFPFFLYTQPEIARDLLLYRYHTLPGAKNRATSLGLRGACYAWESTVTGEDVTPRTILIQDSNVAVPIFTGSQQIHVTADVAYAVWLYWDATLDEDFMLRYGAEILVETARFWATRVSEYEQGFHILGVIGPDEYHSNITDNAFTNWMVRINFQKAHSVYEWMRTNHPSSFAEFCSRLAIAPGEVEQWWRIERTILIPTPNSKGVIEQFKGFFDLQDVTIDNGERLKPPVSRLLQWEAINKQKLIKQADVLMIPFLFQNALSPEVVRANYLFYEPLTDHASSLSLAVHAAIAARIGLEKQAEEYWKQSLNFDVQNLMNNTALGIHAGCMGATWQALVFHLLGIEFKNGAVATNGMSKSSLPRFCQNARLKLFYRRKEFQI